MVAVVQLAIGLGAGVGGLLFDRMGHVATFGASAALLVVASAVAWLASRSTSLAPTAITADASLDSQGVAT